MSIEGKYKACWKGKNIFRADLQFVKYLPSLVSIPLETFFSLAEVISVRLSMLYMFTRSWNERRRETNTLEQPFLPLKSHQTVNKKNEDEPIDEHSRKLRKRIPFDSFSSFSSISLFKKILPLHNLTFNSISYYFPCFLWVSLVVLLRDDGNPRWGMMDE